MRPNPMVFETNARLFLRRLSEKHQRPLTLATIPGEEWELLAGRGFDCVWLMGLWQRSPGARAVALGHPDLRREYGAALPDWTDRDVEGSPYAIYSYRLDPALGAPGDVRVVRERLNRLGLGLMVDFVPNHLSLDHPWTLSHPHRFVSANPEQAAAHPDWFFASATGHTLAHGRDPYFGPWTDTAQLNFFSADLRGALAEELREIAEVADGARCDMAMLGLNEVFEWLWGEHVQDQRPAEEFWSGAITGVRDRHPDFLFLAEAYWGHEPELQRLGFDHTYDKALYDRLRWDDADAVRAHLAAQPSPSRWARFIENHDEERAATAFGAERARAAAAVIATLPGLRLFHDGQAEGRRVRTPVQLIRARQEPEDPATAAFYERLLAACSMDVFHHGAWELVPCVPAGADMTSRHILCWHWRDASTQRLVAVNYSGVRAGGLLQAPREITAWHDELAPATPPVTSSGGAMRLDLAPWQAAILAPAGLDSAS